MTTATMVKERPILFSGSMVRALLAGTKTQTRRVVKLPRWAIPPNEDNDFEMDGDPWWPHACTKRTGCLAAIECPYGDSGDRLWVRETVAIEHWTRDYGDEPPLPKDRPWKHRKTEHPDGDDERWLWPHYRATDPAPDLSCERDNCRTCESGEPGAHWTPSIHMPRWASRLALDITDLRVQRLQDISEEDAAAEGVTPFFNRGDTKPAGYTFTDASGDHGLFSARDAFKGLWGSINGPDSWELNPWVWAITFKRVMA